MVPFELKSRLSLGQEGYRVRSILRASVGMCLGLCAAQWTCLFFRLSLKGCQSLLLKLRQQDCLASFPTQSRPRLVFSATTSFSYLCLKAPRNGPPKPWRPSRGAETNPLWKRYFKVIFVSSEAHRLYQICMLQPQEDSSAAAVHIYETHFCCGLELCFNTCDLADQGGKKRHICNHGRCRCAIGLLVALKFWSSLANHNSSNALLDSLGSFSLRSRCSLGTRSL